MNSSKIHSQSRGATPIQLGITLTAVLVSAYFGFVVLCAFAPDWLGRPLFDGGTVTWAFAYGLFVMVLGVVLTGLYVLVANQADAPQTEA